MLKSCDVALASMVNRTTGMPIKKEAEVSGLMHDEVWPEFFESAAGQALLNAWGGQEKIGEPGKEPFDTIFKTIKDRMETQYGKPGTIGKEWPGVWFCHRLETTVQALLLVRHPNMVPKQGVTPVAATPEMSAKEQFGALVEQAANDIADPTLSSLEIKQKREDREYNRAFEYALKSSEATGRGETLFEPEFTEATPEVRQFAHIYKRGTQSYQPSIGRVTLTVDRDKDYNVLSGDQVRFYHFKEVEWNEKVTAAVKAGLI